MRPSEVMAARVDELAQTIRKLGFSLMSMRDATRLTLKATAKLVAQLLVYACRASRGPSPQH